MPFSQANAEYLAQANAERLAQDLKDEYLADMAADDLYMFCNALIGSDMKREIKTAVYERVQDAELLLLLGWTLKDAIKEHPDDVIGKSAEAILRRYPNHPNVREIRRALMQPKEVIQPPRRRTGNE